MFNNRKSWLITTLRVFISWVMSFSYFLVIHYQYILLCIHLCNILVIYINRQCCWIKDQIEVIYSAVGLRHTDFVGGGEIMGYFKFSLLSCLFNINFFLFFLISVMFVHAWLFFYSRSLDKMDCHLSCFPSWLSLLSHETSGGNLRRNGGVWICNAKTFAILKFFHWSKTTKTNDVYQIPVEYRGSKMYLLSKYFSRSLWCFFTAFWKCPAVSNAFISFVCDTVGK